jgi:hypothetical protein
MKKSDFSKVGGHPFVMDDLAFMQDAWLTGFEGIAKMFKPLGGESGQMALDYTILSGCEVVGLSMAFPNFTSKIEPGFVVVNGEIFYFIGGTFSGNVNDLKSPVFVIKEEFPSPLDPRPYFSGSSENIHFNRYLDFEIKNLGQNGQMYIPIAPRWNDRFTRGLKGEGWRRVGSGGNPDYESDWNAGSNKVDDIYFRKSGNRVSLKGRASYGPGTNSQTSAFTLPIGYRPSSVIRLIIMAIPSNGEQVLLGSCQIIETGQVILSNTTNSSDVLSLDNISFFVD